MANVASVATHPAAERIVFAWEQRGNIDLYMAAMDGTGVRRLTHDPAPDELPRCSPDGHELVFRRGGSARGELIRLNLATLQEVRLTSDDLRDSTPEWSLDGRFVYATKRIGGFDRIVSFDRDGRQLRVLSPERDWHDVMPGLSPDGRTLIFHTYRYGKEAELQLLELEGSATRRLTETPGNDYEAAFAGPDAVVFSSNRAGGYYRIYVQPLASPGPARLLADTGADAWTPRYSATSRHVLFYTGKPGAWRMMTVSIDGGHARPLLDDGGSKSSADWCPSVLAQTPSPALTEAIELQKQGKVDDALALLRQAADATPADAAVHNMLGALLNRGGRYPEALTHAEAAVTHAPDNHRYRMNRGIVLVEHGRFADAVADFDVALARDPSLVYGYLERGSALLSLNRDAEARTQWAAARQVEPTLIWPDWYEGLHDFIDRKYQAASAHFDRVATAEPGFGPAAIWRNLARARAGLPFVDIAPQGDAWPAPLYRMLRERMTLEQVLSIALQDRMTGDPRRVGEALFVAAEMAAVAGRTADANAFYDRAAGVSAPRHAWKIAVERARP